MLVIKKIILLFLAELLTSIIAFSQIQIPPSEIDSLKNNLNSITEDTSRIKTLLNLAGAYTFQNPDSSLLYAEEAKKLSKKLKKPFDFARSLGIIGWSYYLKGNYNNALWNYNKSLSILQALRGKDSRKLNYEIVKFSSALYGNIGVVYSEQADYPKALGNFFKSLKMSKEIGDKKETARHLGNIGNVYFFQLEYKKALAYFIDAIKIAHELEFNELEANTLSNVGAIYRNQANDECSKGNILYALEKIYPESITYFTKSLKLAQKFGYKHLEAVSLDNLGLIFSDQMQYICMYPKNDSLLKNISSADFIETCDSLRNKAMNFYLRALKIDDELQNISGSVMHLGNIGSLLVNSGKFSEGEKYLKQSIAICDTIGDLQSLKEYSFILSHLYDTLANLQGLAAQTNLQGLARREPKQNLEGLPGLSSNDYYKLAFFHYKKYSSAKDAIFSEEKAIDIGRIETRHELDMIEYKRLQIEREKALKEAVALQRRNTLEYSGILIGIFILFSIVFILIRFNLPQWIIELSVFIPFLILFEFVLVLLDPYSERVTSGEPLFKLLINVILAALIFPVHTFFEKKLKQRIYNGKNTENSNQSTYHESAILKTDTDGSSVIFRGLIFFLGWFFISLINSGFYKKTDVTKTVLVDSLMQKLKILNQSSESYKRDTEKVNTLNAIAWELRIDNTTEAINYINKSLELSKKINFRKGTAAAHRSLASISYNQGNYPMALEHHFIAFKISEESNDKIASANTLGNIGLVYWKQGKYTDAISFYFKALDMATLSGDKNRISINLGNIGIVYAEQANYPKALFYYFKALKIKKELGNKSEIALTLGNIGNIYFYEGDYIKALDYYSQALKLDEELKNFQGTARHLGNIGNIYYAKGDYKRALDNYLKVLQLMQKNGEKSEIALWLGNIASIYGEQGLKEKQKIIKDTLYKNAIDYFFKALKIDEELGNKKGMARHLGNIGWLYTLSGNYKTAEKFLKQSLSICDSLKVYDYKKDFEKIISQLYDSTRNYKLAYTHYKKYSEVKDSIYNDEKAKDIGRLELKHEYEMASLKKAQEEAESNRQLAVALSRRNTLEYSGILIGIFALFVFVFFIGKFQLPPWVAKLTVFISFLILFEFILVLLDPYIETMTGGEPVWKLLVNATLAAVIFPLHNLFERLLKRRIMKY